LLAIIFDARFAVIVLFLVEFTGSIFDPSRLDRRSWMAPLADEKLRQVARVMPRSRTSLNLLVAER
jgi:hypothetical protein